VLAVLGSAAISRATVLRKFGTSSDGRSYWRDQIGSGFPGRRISIARWTVSRVDVIVPCRIWVAPRSVPSSAKSSARASPDRRNERAPRTDLILNASGEELTLRITRHIAERPDCQDARRIREDPLPRVPHPSSGDRRDGRHYRSCPLLPRSHLRANRRRHGLPQRLQLRREIPRRIVTPPRVLLHAAIHQCAQGCGPDIQASRRLRRRAPSLTESRRSRPPRGWTSMCGIHRKPARPGAASWLRRLVALSCQAPGRFRFQFDSRSSAIHTRAHGRQTAAVAEQALGGELPISRLNAHCHGLSELSPRARRSARSGLKEKATMKFATLRFALAHTVSVVGLTAFVNPAHAKEPMPGRTTRSSRQSRQCGREVPQDLERTASKRI
jgi:hypothetical protein